MRTHLCGLSVPMMDRGLDRAAHVAQLAERILGKDEVTSSILVVGSRCCSFHPLRKED